MAEADRDRAFETIYSVRELARRIICLKNSVVTARSSKDIMKNNATISKEYLRVLHKLFSRLNNSGINWVIIGSTGLALRGILVKPKDIDVQTDESGVYEIELIFKEYVEKKVIYSSTGKIRSYFGTLNIDGTKVEIMGDNQKIVDGKWETALDLNHYKEIVEFEGMKLPLLSLKCEYAEYIKLGRQEKAEMIKEFLRTQK